MGSVNEEVKNMAISEGSGFKTSHQLPPSMPLWLKRAFLSQPGLSSAEQGPNSTSTRMTVSDEAEAVKLEGEETGH